MVTTPAGLTVKSIKRQNYQHPIRTLKSIALKTIGLAIRSRIGYQYCIAVIITALGAVPFQLLAARGGGRRGTIWPRGTTRSTIGALLAIAAHCGPAAATMRSSLASLEANGRCGQAPGDWRRTHRRAAAAAAAAPATSWPARLNCSLQPGRAPLQCMQAGG